MVNYKKIKELKENNKNYNQLMKNARDIVLKYIPELEYIDISISLDYMVSNHGIDCLKGIIGVDKFEQEHAKEYPNTALGCIAHDLPRPSNLKDDIYPKVMSYTQYCSI
tara:strand:- start:454 stop:780 length:327 start_codon:yes stop_codon:yes gene_type:complete